MQRHRLEDVFVSNVHLVGRPANRRPFAIVKSMGKPHTTIVDEETSVDTKALMEALGKNEKMSLADLVKATGADEKEVAEALAAIKKESDGEDDKATKAKKAEAEAEAEKKRKAGMAKSDESTEALVKQVGELTAVVKAMTDAKATETAESLKKRATLLKSAGFEIDPDKATEDQVTAIESTRNQYNDLLKSIGVNTAFGTAEADEPGGSVIERVNKEVERRLGHAPRNAQEATLVKSELYDENDGLLGLVLDEEQSAKGILV